MANQKGGVGKTTITVMLSTLLRYENGKKILILDADFQRSIAQKRKKEIRQIMASEEQLILFSRNLGINYDELKGQSAKDMEDTLTKAIDKKIYTVIECDPKNVMDYIKAWYGKVDYIFIDVPGNIRQEGIVNLLQRTELIMIPMVASELDIDSTAHFIKILGKIKKVREENGLSMSILGVLNKKTNKKKNQFLVEAMSKNRGIMLDAMIPLRVAKYDDQMSTIYKSNDEYFKELKEEFIQKTEKLQLVAQ